MLFFTRRADPCDHVGRVMASAANRLFGEVVEPMDRYAALVMALGTHLHQDLGRAECGNTVK